jgi:hypothetical protein
MNGPMYNSTGRDDKEKKYIRDTDSPFLSFFPTGSVGHPRTPVSLTKLCWRHSNYVAVPNLYADGNKETEREDRRESKREGNGRAKERECTERSDII